MEEISIEIKTRSYQQLLKELEIPKDEVWAQYPEHGIEINVQVEYCRTAGWDAIVTIVLAAIADAPILVNGAKWLYEKIKASRADNEVVIVRREKVTLTETVVIEIVKEVWDKSQNKQLDSLAILSHTIPEQIQQLAALREAGALTEEEFTSQKTELLARM